MARTTIKVQFSIPFANAEEIVKNILASEGYKEINYNNEIVWKRGVGMLTAMQYIKTEYTSNTLTLSGWIQTGIGNVGGKEMALRGFVGGMPKKKVLNVMARIQQSLR